MSIKSALITQFYRYWKSKSTLNIQIRWCRVFTLYIFWSHFGYYRYCTDIVGCWLMHMFLRFHRSRGSVRIPSKHFCTGRVCSVISINTALRFWYFRRRDHVISLLNFDWWFSDRKWNHMYLVIHCFWFPYDLGLLVRFWQERSSLVVLRESKFLYNFSKIFPYPLIGCSHLQALMKLGDYGCGSMRAVKVRQSLRWM